MKENCKYLIINGENKGAEFYINRTPIYQCINVSMYHFHIDYM